MIFLGRRIAVDIVKQTFSRTYGKALYIQLNMSVMVVGLSKPPSLGVVLEPSSVSVRSNAGIWNARIGDVGDQISFTDE